MTRAQKALLAITFLIALATLILIVVEAATPRHQPGELLPFTGLGERLPVASHAPQVVLSDLVITGGERPRASITIKNRTSHYLWVTVCVAVYREHTKWPDALFSFSTPSKAAARP